MSGNIIRQALIARRRTGPASCLLAALNPVPVVGAEDEQRQALRELAQFNRDLKSGKYDAEREAQRQAEADAEARENMSAAELLHAVLSAKPTADHNSQQLPLNGAALLRSALKGAGVTINGG